MKRLALIGFLVLAAALPGAAPGAGCSPLDRAASGVPVGDGRGDSLKVGARL